MKRAFVFPGQGSQFPGMGKALAEVSSTARYLFEEIDDALSQRLSRLMFEGAESDLMLTENAQPALLATSLAVMRVLEAEAGFDLARGAVYVAGHSLGEYSALAAAGALSVPDAARLVKRRGQAMQKAVPVGEGAMAALLGLGTRVRARCIDQGDQWEVELLRHPVEPDRLAVSLGVRHAEAARDVLLGRRPTLLRDHDHRTDSFELGDPADDRRVVAVTVSHGAP